MPVDLSNPINSFDFLLRPFVAFEKSTRRILVQSCVSVTRLGFYFYRGMNLSTPSALGFASSLLFTLSSCD